MDPSDTRRPRTCAPTGANSSARVHIQDGEAGACPLEGGVLVGFSGSQPQGRPAKWPLSLRRQEGSAPPRGPGAGRQGELTAGAVFTRVTGPRGRQEQRLCPRSAAFPRFSLEPSPLPPGGLPKPMWMCPRPHLSLERIPPSRCGQNCRPPPPAGTVMPSPRVNGRAEWNLLKAQLHLK